MHGLRFAGIEAAIRIPGELAVLVAPEALQHREGIAFVEPQGVAYVLAIELLVYFLEAAKVRGFEDAFVDGAGFEADAVLDIEADDVDGFHAGFNRQAEEDDLGMLHGVKEADGVSE